MPTKQDAIIKVNAFVQELLQSGVSLDKVILFGSYSNGTQTKDSDIDVALVSSMFNGFGFEDRKLFSRINIKNEFLDIETKTYPTNYFINGDPFITEILKTGIELHSTY